MFRNQSWYERNFLHQVYVENAKISFYADIPDNYNIFFWECTSTSFQSAGSDINNRTLSIFYFYGLGRIFYGCIDFFLIRIKDFYGFLFGPWVPKNL